MGNLEATLDRPITERYDREHIEAMEGVDVCFWAVRNKIKLIGNTEFTLNGCGYLKDIIRSDAQEKVIMKAAQSRITTLFMLDSIHGLIFNKYPQGVIYYFPSETAVEQFSKTRFSPLVADNSSIKRYLRDTNSVSVKKVGKTFLSLLGCKATQSVGGKKDGTSVRSTPADYVIRDERDLFDDDMANQTKQRLLNSEIGKEVDLGTPTIPDYGISKCFSQSDQRHWMVKCEGCNHWMNIGTEFPNSIKYGEGKPYLVCVKCGGGIDPRNGQWVAKYPDRRVAGWYIEHFITPNCNLSKIMERWESDQREGKVGEFYNSILGLPYISIEDRLSEQSVYNLCSNDIMASYHSGPCAMGVDVGKVKHVVIGIRTGVESYEIVKVAQVATFNDIHDLMQRFNVKSAVIDIRPYEDEARDFQKKERCRIFLCEYAENAVIGSAFNEKTGIVKVNRTEIFDTTHRMVMTCGMLRIPRINDTIKEFAKQVCACAKTLEENEKTGGKVYRYRALGDDHYRNALNYFYLAASSHRIGIVNKYSGKNRQLFVDSDYKRV